MRAVTKSAPPGGSGGRFPAVERGKRIVSALLAAPADRVIPGSLFVASLCVRLRYLNEGLFHPDEVALARAVEGSWDHGTLLGAFNGRYGSVLLNLLSYVPWHWVTGQNAERVVPFTAAVTGSLLVAAVYLLARELYEGRTAAILSALFLGFNFLSLSTSTTGKENTHSLFFLTAGMVLLAAGHRKRSAAHRYAGFASGAAALAMHEAVFPLLAVQMFFAACLAVRHRQPRGRFAGEMLAGLAIAAASCALYLGPVILDAATSTGSSSTPVFRGPFSGILPHVLGDLAVVVGWPFVPLAVLGVWAARRDPGRSLFLLPWLLLILYYGNVSTYTPRYLVYLLVPLSLLAGSGGGFLVDGIGPRAVALPVAVGLGIAVGGYGIWNAYPLISNRSVYSGPKRMALYAKEKTERDAVIVTMDASVFYGYYGNRGTESHPVNDGRANRLFVEKLLGMAGSGKKLYVDTTAFSYDKEGVFEILLSGAFRLEPVGNVVGEEWNDSELKPEYFVNTLYRLRPLRGRD